MEKTDYERYLRSGHWQRFKKYYFRFNERRCFVCSCEKDINLHHLHYKSVGREQMKDVVALCIRCHSEVHRRYKGRVDPDAHILLRRDYLRHGSSIFIKKKKPKKRYSPQQQTIWKAAIQLSCPTCRASAGQKCFGKGNRPRTRHHAARITRARQMASVKILKVDEMTLAEQIEYGFVRRPAVSPNLRLDFF